MKLISGSTGRSRLMSWLVSATAGIAWLAGAPDDASGANAYWNAFSTAGNPKYFNLATNWSPAVVPGPDDTVWITNFPHAYNLAWTAPVVNQAAHIDFGGNSKTIRLGPANWIVTDSVRVGNGTPVGKPTIWMDSGSWTITNASGSGTLYANWGTPGGGWARLNAGGILVVDHLYASNSYASLGFDMINVGTLTTRGDSVLVRAAANNFYMAGSGGAAARWNILGGTCRVGQDMSLGAPNVGGATTLGATATVVVAGNTASLVAERAVAVGAQGNGVGRVVITNGGMAQVAGLLRLGGSSMPNNWVTITGTNSLLKTLSQVYLYSYNHNNVLRIENGGKWEHNAANQLYFVGLGPSTNNAVVVDGPGSTFTGFGTLSLAGGAGVTDGQGRIVVSNGGAITNSAWGTIAVGVTANGYGEVLITGAGSRLIQTSGNLVAGRGNAYSSGYAGTGKVVVADGGLLQSPSIHIGSNTWGNLTCDGGILQFPAYPPALTIREAGGVILTNATVSFRGIANASVAWQDAKIVYQGRNAFRLNNATNATTGQAYVFDTGLGAAHYARLEMVGGGTRYRGGSATIGAGGSMLISGTVATFDSTATNRGALEVVASTVNGNLLNRNGSTMTPGSTAAPATFTVGGTFSLETGARLDLTVNGPTAVTQCDQIVVGAGGTLDLNADSGAGSTLRPILGYAPTVGDSIKIIDNQGGTISGSFAENKVEAYYQGRVYLFVVQYGAGPGDDVFLYVAPRGTVVLLQ